MPGNPSRGYADSRNYWKAINSSDMRFNCVLIGFNLNWTNVDMQVQRQSNR